MEFDLAIELTWVNNLKVGDSIRNKNPYKGEHEYLFEKHVKGGMASLVMARAKKYPSLNGQIEIMCKAHIAENYEKIN